MIGFLVHPGEVLLLDVIQPLGLTQAEFARRLGISTGYLSDVIHGRRSVGPELAVRIAGQTNGSPQFWLNLQSQFDLAAFEVRQQRRTEPSALPRSALVNPGKKRTR